MPEEPLLKPEEVASVLSKDETAEATDDTLVYSLRKPVAIAPDSEATARARLEALAGGVNRALDRCLESTIDIEVQGFQQEQTGAAVKTLPRPAWILSFFHADGGGVSLALEPMCALSMVELALGGVGTGSTGAREPTPLEVRVLSNLCTSAAKTLTRLSETAFVGGAFHKGSVPATLAAAGQTVGVGLLKIKVGGGEQRSGLLLVTAGLLKDRDRSTNGPEPKIGPLAPLLRDVRVSTRPVLQGGLVSVADLRSLRPGAVLRLRSGEDRPLELRVQGHAIFGGHVLRDENGASFRVERRRGRATYIDEEEQA